MMNWPGRAVRGDLLCVGDADTVDAEAVCVAVGVAIALRRSELFLEAAVAIITSRHVALVDAVDVVGAGHTAEATDTEHAFVAVSSVDRAVTHRRLIGSANTSSAGLTFATGVTVAGRVTGRVDAASVTPAVFVEDAVVGADLEVGADPCLTGLTDGAALALLTGGVAGAVHAVAVTTLEVEDANGREVGAAATDAQVAIFALAVFDTAALAIGAGPLVGNADPSVVTGETRAVGDAVCVLGARPSVDAEPGLTARVIAVAIGAVFIRLAERGAIITGDTGVAVVADIALWAGPVPVAVPRGVAYAVVTDVSRGTVGVGVTLIGATPSAVRRLRVFAVDEDRTS